MIKEKKKIWAIGVIALLVVSGIGVVMAQLPEELEVKISEEIEVLKGLPFDVPEPIEFVLDEENLTELEGIRLPQFRMTPILDKTPSLEGAVVLEGLPFDVPEPIEFVLDEENLTELEGIRLPQFRMTPILDKTPLLTRVEGDACGYSKDSSQAERAIFHVDDTYRIYQGFGHVKPTESSNNGESFTSYHEREIYLNDNDTIEFISHIYDDGRVFVWTSILDEGVWVQGWDFGEQVNIGDDVEYSYTISNGKYTLYLKDPDTGQWYAKTYDDTDDPSDHVDWFMGSTELTYDVLDKEFKTETWIRDDWYWDTAGNVHRPWDVIDWWYTTPDEPNVEVTVYTDSYNRLYTQHICQFPAI